MKKNKLLTILAASVVGITAVGGAKVFSDKASACHYTEPNYSYNFTPSTPTNTTTSQTTSTSKTIDTSLDKLNSKLKIDTSSNLTTALDLCNLSVEGKNMNKASINFYLDTLCNKIDTNCTNKENKTDCSSKKDDSSKNDCSCKKDDSSKKDESSKNDCSSKKDDSSKNDCSSKKDDTNKDETSTQEETTCNEETSSQEETTSQEETSSEKETEETPNVEESKPDSSVTVESVPGSDNPYTGSLLGFGIPTLLALLGGAAFFIKKKVLR